MDLKKLFIRSASGLVYIGVIIGCCLWGIYPFSVMAAVFAILAAMEFERISHGPSVPKMPALVLDVLGVVCLAFSWMYFPLLAWIVILAARMIYELYANEERPIAGIANSFMTQLYVGLPLGLMTFIGTVYGLHMVLCIFIMIWVNDTGAFLVGSTLGRHRLFERISPKKSWEGFFGGLVFNIGLSIWFRYSFSGFFGFSSSLGVWIGLGILVTVFATWGDLVESMIKRSLHLKDSGNLIPGHGGILDRIDSLLMVMPMSFIYLNLVTILG